LLRLALNITHSLTNSQLIIALFIYRLILFLFLFAAELKPPTNVNITISGNNVTVTWTLPGESETFTYLEFYSSGGREKEKYIRSPQSSYTVTLTSCKKYRLDMQCSYYYNLRWSERVMTTFWVTGM